MSPLVDYIPTVGLRRSLRLKLLLISVLVEMVMLTLLVANGARLIRDHLVENTQIRLDTQEQSFNIALAGLLAARDYGSIQSVLEGWSALPGITYMQISDNSGRVVASHGLSEGQILPPPNNEISPQFQLYHGDFDITYLGQRYGYARYGLDTSFLGKAQSELIRQSVAIAIAEVVLTLGLLASIGYWLTRHLALLTRASLRVAQGDFSFRLKLDSQDEIGVLSQAFNAMSAAVESRMSQLEESERRFRAIADYTYGWETWFDAKGQLRWVNPAVERITGYQLAECRAMVNFPLPMVIEEDRSRVRGYFAKALAGESGQDAEFRIQSHDRSELWVEMSWQPIFDDSGASLGFRVSIRDITVQRKSAEMLIDAKAELERMLFAASHDLQEPVRGILIHLQLLERQFGDAIPEDAKRSLETARASGNQMTLLVKGLLAYSVSDRSMNAFIPVDCQSIIRRVVEDYRSHSGALPPLFHLGDLPKVMGDPSLLFILFDNLVSNAIKFVASDVCPEIGISAVFYQGGWRIDVSDNGIGIEPDYLEQVYRPFSRLHARSIYPGAGLGLASALKITRNHGGKLWLDSVPGQGTTAHVWLPALPVS